MNKPKLYLAGKMSGLTFDQMNSWRLKATQMLDENFHIINPCNYYNFEIDRSTYTDHEVKQFDLWLVKNSNIVLVNLDYPDSIGTAIELHMAHDEWDIPVIAYGGQNVEVHPWMLESITKRCDTLEDAVNHINSFYLINI